MFTLICFVVLLFPVVLLAAAYKAIPTIIYNFIHSFLISDWITFFACILTYYGTAILSLVTVYQNNSLRKMQKRELDLHERALRQSTRPILEVSEFRYDVIDNRRKYTSLKPNWRDCKMEKAAGNEGFGKYTCEISMENVEAVIFRAKFVCKQATIACLKAKTLALRLPIIPFSSYRELFYRYFVHNWRIRQSNINESIKNANNQKEYKIPKFYALATRYMVDSLWKEVEPEQAISFAYVVEQSTSIRYVLPVWIKNIYDHEYVQEIILEMALDREKLTVEFESLKEYDRVFGENPVDYEVIHEKLCSDS